MVDAVPNKKKGKYCAFFFFFQQRLHSNTTRHRFVSGELLFVKLLLLLLLAVSAVSVYVISYSVMAYPFNHYSIIILAVSSTFSSV